MRKIWFSFLSVQYRICSPIFLQDSKSFRKVYSYLVFTEVGVLFYYLTWEQVTWGWPKDCASLFTLILVCVPQHRWQNAIGQKLKLPLIRWPSLKIHIIGTEKRTQVRQTCSIFEQYEPWTEPQLHLRSTWICCAIIVWNYSLFKSPIAIGADVLQIAARFGFVSLLFL
jgi:hypothetical protein